MKNYTYKEMFAKITACFRSVVGMEDEVRQLINSCMSYFNGGELVSPIIEAEAGKGKTCLLVAYKEALEILGLEVVLIQPSEFRKSDDAVWAQIKLLAGGERKNYALLVDEAHGVWQNGATVQLQKFGTFCLKALDGNFKGGAIDLGDDITFGFSRKNCVIALATNFPGRLPDAIKSRGKRMILPDYTIAELGKILVGMAKKDGLALDAISAKMVAKCGRGTARPMEQIVRQIGITLGAKEHVKKTVSRADVLNALRDLQMYPAGLNVHEVKMLQMLVPAPLPERIIGARLPGVETAQLRKSKAFLMSPTEAKDGSFTDMPLLAMVAGGFQTTKKGEKYLAEAEKAGFTW